MEFDNEVKRVKKSFGLQKGINIEGMKLKKHPKEPGTFICTDFTRGISKECLMGKL
jgi:hypothetical protein